MFYQKLNIIKIYNQYSWLPFWRKLFSKAVAAQAPYFKSMHPLITELTTTKCSVYLKKRKAIQNHLNTIHVIAMCNAAEMAAGVVTQACLPKNLRWIPAGMTVKYIKKAKTDVTATADVTTINWQQCGDLIIHIDVKDTNQVVVFTADITMNIKTRQTAC